MSGVAKPLGRRYRAGREASAVPLFQTFGRRIYIAVAEMTWVTLAALAAVHAVVAYILFVACGEEGLVGDLVTYVYFYVTTATTVGYGDLSPATAVGRMVGAFWMLPGSIALFTAVLGKGIADLGGFWRKRMNGLGDYSSRTGHTVVLGWQGVRTRRLVELLLSDRQDGESIVLVSKNIAENPMPEQIDFIRADALSTPRGLERSGMSRARSIVIRGDDDDETLAATLAAASVAPDAHVVAYFDDERAADLVHRQCPGVEAIGSLSAELLVRSSRDPGASLVADLMFSSKSEDTAFSLKVPAFEGRLTYMDVMVGLKRRNDITVVGVATGNGDVDLNCPAGEPIGEGTTLFYIADNRLKDGEIDWAALARERQAIGVAS